jgi:hypothetical protein
MATSTFNIHDLVRVTYPFDHTFNEVYQVTGVLENNTYILEDIGAFDIKFLEAVL